MTCEQYDFQYVGLMKDARQSIPLGNGDLGINVWAKEDGIYLLLSKDDAWSEGYRLLKTGYLKISCTPNLFTENIKFHLSLCDGVLYIYTDAGATFAIWVDANSPIYRISINSEKTIFCRVEIINYRDKEIVLDKNDHSNYMLCIYDGSEEPYLYESRESADILFSRNEHSLGQYHRNNWTAYDFSMKHQGLENYPNRKDPLMHLTFGYMIQSDQLYYTNGRLETPQDVTNVEIAIASVTRQCELPEEWLKAICDILQKKDCLSENSFRLHSDYWAKQWKTSWIYVSKCEQADVLTRGYIYQRYMNICAGRGNQPIKFNGSIFTVEPSPHVKNQDNFDYRAWGGLYWFQNTRLIYWNMLFSGDFELMLPLFQMYFDSADLLRYRTKEYFGHEGLFFPETMTFCGLYSNNNYGWNRENRHKSYCKNRCIRWYYSNSLELVLMMLTYSEYAGDSDFLYKKVLPFAHEVLKFFISHYEVPEASLVRIFSPTSSLETWKECVDDTPTIAGIRCICERMITLPKISNELMKDCQLLLDTLPPIPLELSKDGSKEVIAPCRVRLDYNCNVENPELYAIFPYQQYGMGKDSLQLAVDTYFNRTYTTSCGWQQHAIQAALLGLHDEVLREMSVNFAQVNKNCIFPSYYGPNYDWMPDQDTGSVAGIALVLSLLQIKNDKIWILPVWDMKADVHFRLPVGNENFIEVIYKDGLINQITFDAEPQKIVVIGTEEKIVRYEVK